MQLGQCGRNGNSFATLACLLVLTHSASLAACQSIAQFHQTTDGSNARTIHTRLGDCIHRDEAFWEFCGKPLGDEAPQQLDFQFAEALLLKKSVGGGICSEFAQDWMLWEIFQKIGTTNRFFVEFGARRPQILNSAHFRLNCGWPGLLLDGAPGATPNGACASCADLDLLLHAPDNATVRLRKAFLTKENINDVFNKTHVPETFDLLTVDIDGNDYWILKGLDMDKYLPRVVAAEFSPYFNKYQPYVQKYDPEHVWHPDEVVGSSLVALDALLRSRGYSYVTQVDGAHAIWVLDRALHRNDRGGVPIPERVNEGWMANSTDFDPQHFQEVDPDANSSLSHHQEVDAHANSSLSHDR